MSRNRRYSSLIAALLVVILTACGSTQQTGEVATEATTETTSPPTSLVGDASAGQQVFEQNCISCHGPQGTGGGALALNPARSSLQGSDEAAFNQNITNIITHGKGRMPAWGDAGRLTSQQIADVAAYIISLNK